MRKAVLGVVSLTILVIVIQTWAQAPPEQAAPIPEADQKHILETFGRNLKDLEENPDVLGIVPSPGTGEIWIISDRPGNVPKVVEDVPVKILPPPPHLPPPLGVIVLRPGGVIERREDLNNCPEEFKEETKYRWRFCQPIEGNPEPLPGHLLNPPVAGVPYEKAEEIFKRNEEKLMQILGTNGVGLGLDGITIYTDHPELVPNDIEGIPVKAVLRQEFRRTSHTTTQTTIPFHGGTAIGVTLPGWGTSTGIVLADGKPWLLFTAHSLVGCENDPTPPLGCPINGSPLASCPHYSGELVYQSPLQNPQRVGATPRWTKLIPDPSSPLTLNEDVAAAFVDNDTTEGNGSLSVDRNFEGLFGFRGTEGTPTIGDSIYIITALSEGSPSFIPHVVGGTIQGTSQSISSDAPCVGTFGADVTSRNQLFYSNSNYTYRIGTSGAIVISSSGQVLGMHNASSTSPNPPFLGLGTKNADIRFALKFDAWYGNDTVKDQTISVFRPSAGQWIFDNGNGKWDGTVNGDPRFSEQLCAFGLANDLAVTGNWDGNSAQQVRIGTFRPSTSEWWLDTGTCAWEPSDLHYNFGLSGDLPVAGYWRDDDTDRDKIEVFRSGQFILDNGNGVWNGCGAFPAQELCFAFGAAEDKPVAGDWDGNGIDTIGVFRPSESKYYLRNSNSAGPPDIVVTAGVPSFNYQPVVGNWTGTGATAKLGVYRPSTTGWYLDEGNLVFPGCAEDQCPAFGLNGDQPVAWNKSTVKAN